MIDPEKFAHEIETSAKIVFGSSELGLKIRRIADAMLSDCARWNELGVGSPPAIAIVGIGAVGKSWLARSFVKQSPDNASLLTEIRSGQNAADRTHSVIWFGHSVPHSVSGVSKNHRLIEVSPDKMLDLGIPYSVIDTPGVDDDLDRSAEFLTGSIIKSTPIKLLAVSEEKIRSADQLNLLREMQGSVIVPVIRFEADNGAAVGPTMESRQSVIEEMNRWRSALPNLKHLTEPIFMPRTGLDPEAIEAGQKIIRTELKKVLIPLLGDKSLYKEAIGAEIVNRMDAARNEIHQSLTDFRDRVSVSFAQLEARTQEIPEKVTQQLIGDDALLRAGIRRRFRADWLERTPSLFFPQRSLCGLLALTQGAWDRLIFAAFGSAPSLAMTLFQAAKNVKSNMGNRDNLSDAFKTRIETMVGEALQQDMEFFVNSLAATQVETLSDLGNTSEVKVSISGVDDIQNSYATIVADTIRKKRSLWIWPFFMAVAGCASFLFLLSGPLISLYRQYIGAFTLPWHKSGAAWSSFPAPSFSMIVTSMLLSLAPALLIAIIGVFWSCHGLRVKRAANRIKTDFKREIQASAKNKSLGINVDDPRVDAAQYLLNL